MKLEEKILAYSNWVLNHKWLVILSTIVFVLLIASGGRFLYLTSEYRVFFSEDNAELIAFDKLEKTYTKNDNVMFIVTPSDGNVFTEDTLSIVRELTERAWQIPYSIRVDSISNFQHTVAEADDLVVDDLVAKDDLSSQEIEEIRNVALGEPQLVGRLISPKGHVTGVNVIIQLPGKDLMAEEPEVVHFARQLAAQIREQYPSVEIRLSGMVVMNTAFTEASQADMRFLVPLSFLTMFVILGALLRAVSGTVAVMVVVLFSILAALGAGGYLGFPITPPSSITPTVVMTVAIANTVHVLVTFFHEYRLGRTRREAMIESMRLNITPVFLASTTTAIGFLSMNFSDVPPFNHLGNMVAAGVLASIIFSLYFLPAFMMVLPVRVKQHHGTQDYVLMDRFGDFVVKQRNRLILSMLAIITILVMFLPRNELNDVFVEWFDQSMQFRQDADYFAENLSGLYVVDYSLESGNKGGVSDPLFMKDVEKFAQWYRQQPETINVNSYTDVMMRLNKNMHGDDQEWYRLPEGRELAAQYLMLYEMSLPYGLDLNNQINVDKSATRFSVSLETMSSNRLLEVEQRAEEWLAKNTSTITNAKASGTIMMFSYIGKKNIVSMLIGTTLALVLISIILIFALRSVKIGLISLLPNLVPAAMGFGLWGLFVGEVGLALSIVSSMTLGIVVDDTVHFLSKYLRGRREKGLDSHEATRYAFHTVGLAIVTTTVVLVAGFGILALSPFTLNSEMGVLTAIVILLALVTDFILLPPLLMKIEEKKDASIHV